MKTMVVGTMLTLASVAAGQCVSVQQAQVSLDRWMYGFNSTPGVETSASTFGAISQAGFDDRDAQVLLGWNTAGYIPDGAASYLLRSVRITLYTSVSDRFFYDPTADSVVSLYSTSDPEYVADADPGRPVELYGAGYRNGMTAATFGETTAFAPVPPFPPQEGVRSVFAAVFDEAGNATDISRQVRQRFESTPMAIGMIPGLTGGERPNAGTAMSFQVDLSSATTRDYITRGLREGRLRFIVTSLEPASGGPGGGTGSPSYPAFYMRENLISPAFGATLDIDVVALPEFDVNQDGSLDQDDVVYLINVVGGGENPNGVDPDLNFDGNTDQDDISLLINVIAGGEYACP
ncbi:MAG: hypothetical protein DYG92_10435 [Leptolyngbya sp. PLA1]|nr:hypothetical protein [Leptolyngbya sp. PLA1]